VSHESVPVPQAPEGRAEHLVHFFVVGVVRHYGGATAGAPAVTHVPPGRI
jgi:hypothetical protein